MKKKLPTSKEMIKIRAKAAQKQGRAYLDKYLKPGPKPHLKDYLKTAKITGVGI